MAQAIAMQWNMPYLAESAERDIWKTDKWWRSFCMVVRANNLSDAAAQRQLSACFSHNTPVLMWLIDQPAFANLDAFYTAFKQQWWGSDWVDHVKADIRERMQGVCTGASGSAQWESPHAYLTAVRMMNNVLPAADRMPENQLMSLALRNLARGYRMLLIPHAPYENFDALLREALQKEKEIGTAPPSEAEIAAMQVAAASRGGMRECTAASADVFVNGIYRPVPVMPSLATTPVPTKAEMQRHQLRQQQQQHRGGATMYTGVYETRARIDVGEQAYVGSCGEEPGVAQQLAELRQSVTCVMKLLAQQQGGGDGATGPKR